MENLSLRATRKALELGMPRLKLIRPDRSCRQEPIFVIGSGRSGNTLVRRVLMASGQIYIPPETYVLGEVIESWPATALMPWRQRVWHFCSFFERHPHFPTFGLGNLNEFAAEAITLDDRGLRPLIAAFYRYLARQSGHTVARWGDKTPWNTHHLTAIGQLFPRAKYLWLIRDGRDVALSYTQAGLYPDAASAARRWKEANQACERFARWCPDMRKVHYESLVENPERIFATIFDWAGLEFDPEMVNASVGPMGDVEALAHHARVSSPISPSSVGRWRTDMPPEDLRVVSGVIGPKLTALGYG